MTTVGTQADVKGVTLGTSLVAAVTQTDRWLAPFIAIAALLPSVVWILADNAVWPWDQAWYGQVSADLFDALVMQPDRWPALFSHAFAIKAPGIAWIAEFLIPVARAIGAVNPVLLCVPLIASLLTLWLTFDALLTITRGDRFSSLVGMIVVATGPLFVALSHQFVVEPLQLLATAWAVWIAAQADRRTAPYLLVQLIAATTFGLLIKVSSPLYTFAPGGLVLLVIAARLRTRSRTTAGVVRRLDPVAWRTWIPLGLGTVLLLASTGLWYAINWQPLLAQVALDHSGPVADLYGTKAPLLQKLPFWIVAMQKSFFSPLTAVVCTAVAAVGVVSVVRKRTRDFPLLVALSALLELVAVVVAFASATPEETRYLLAAAVHVGVVVAWALSVIRFRLVNAFVLLALLVQWVVVNGQALGMLPMRADLSAWLIAPRAEAHEVQLAEATVRATCQPFSYNRYTVVGVDLPWFNANSLAYIASVRRAERLPGNCYYTAMGFGPTDVDRAVQRIQDLNALYFVTLDHSAVAYATDLFNGSNDAVATRIASDPTFAPVSAGPEASEILIYQKASGSGS